MRAPHVRRCTPKNLGRMIKRVLGNKKFGAAAQAVGERIRKEDGTGEAVKRIVNAIGYV